MDEPVFPSYLRQLDYSEPIIGTRDGNPAIVPRLVLGCNFNLPPGCTVKITAYLAKIMRKRGREVYSDPSTGVIEERNGRKTVRRITVYGTPNWPTGRVEIFEEGNKPRFLKGIRSQLPTVA